MLSLLRIRNLTLIEELEIEFGPGLNVFTGETGAGKSMLLRAVELLSGKRCSTEVIGRWGKRCELEGLFLLSSRDIERLADYSEELEDSFADEELLIRRVIDVSGRGKMYINGRLSTAAIVQRVTALLLDVTAQHQHQLLLDLTEHRRFVDRFGVDRVLLSNVSDCFFDYSRARSALENFRKDSSAKEGYFSRLRFELDELESANLKANERVELETELSRLSGFEELSFSVDEALEFLSGEDESIGTRLSALKAIIHRAVELDSSLTELDQLISSAVVMVDEARLGLSDYAARLELDPSRLEFIRERIAEIAKLERKYGKPLAELLVYREEIAREVSLFESGEFDVKQLESRLAVAKKALCVDEAKLTVARKSAAEKLSKQVVRELDKVNMKRAEFQVSVEQGESSSTGCDRVEFLLSANPGEPLRALAKVASGGELSRVLLVLKSVLNEELGATLQVFDEIDAGIGGRVAHVVGEKLKRISRFSQVILVTHAPQIAAFGDNHYLVSKRSSQNTTKVTVNLLESNRRVDEVARMLAGKTVTEEFEKSARELLNSIQH